MKGAYMKVFLAAIDSLKSVFMVLFQGASFLYSCIRRKSIEASLAALKEKWSMLHWVEKAHLCAFWLLILLIPLSAISAKLSLCVALIATAYLIPRLTPRPQAQGQRFIDVKAAVLITVIAMTSVAVRRTPNQTANSGRPEAQGPKTATAGTSRSQVDTGSESSARRQEKQDQLVKSAKEFFNCINYGPQVYYISSGKLTITNRFIVGDKFTKDAPSIKEFNKSPSYDTLVSLIGNYYPDEVVNWKQTPPPESKLVELMRRLSARQYTAQYEFAIKAAEHEIGMITVRPRIIRFSYDSEFANAPNNSAKNYYLAFSSRGLLMNDLSISDKSHGTHQYSPDTFCEVLILSDEGFANCLYKQFKESYSKYVDDLNTKLKLSQVTPESANDSIRSFVQTLVSNTTSPLLSNEAVYNAMATLNDCVLNQRMLVEDKYDSQALFREQEDSNSKWGTPLNVSADQMFQALFDFKKLPSDTKRSAELLEGMVIQRETLSSDFATFPGEWMPKILFTKEELDSKVVNVAKRHSNYTCPLTGNVFQMLPPVDTLTTIESAGFSVYDYKDKRSVKWALTSGGSIGKHIPKCLCKGHAVSPIKNYGNNLGLVVFDTLDGVNKSYIDLLLNNQWSQLLGDGQNRTKVIPRSSLVDQLKTFASNSSEERYGMVSVDVYMHNESVKDIIGNISLKPKGTNAYQVAIKSADILSSQKSVEFKTIVQSVGLKIE
jgi:hypothetical protein